MKYVMSSLGEIIKIRYRNKFRLVLLQHPVMMVKIIKLVSHFLFGQIQQISKIFLGLR